MVREFEFATMLLIVVGSSPAAEINDRPIGYRLREAIEQLIRAGSFGENAQLTPLVCGDVWYLNDPEARLRPTIAIGAPEVNAATAWLATRLPTALLAENAYRIHLDPELLDFQACMWGVDAQRTAEAVEVFTHRSLKAFLQDAVQHDR